MLVQLLNVYDLVTALVLAAWVGFGGLWLLKGIRNFLGNLSWRMRSPSRIAELENQVDDLLLELRRKHKRKRN